MQQIEVGLSGDNIVLVIGDQVCMLTPAAAGVVGTTMVALARHLAYEEALKAELMTGPDALEAGDVAVLITRTRERLLPKQPKMPRTTPLTV